MAHASTYPRQRIAVPNGQRTGVTQAASQAVDGGVHNGDFAVGTGSRSSTGFIGSESYGWGIGNTSFSGGAMTASFVSFLNKTMMKMVVTGLSKSGSTIAQSGIYSVGVYSGGTLSIDQQKHFSPVVAGQIYKLSWRQFIESINLPSNIDVKGNVTFYDSSYNRLTATITYTADDTVNTLKERSFEVTAPTGAVYALISAVAVGAGTDFTGGDVTWYITDIRFDRKSAAVTNAGTLPSPYLPAIQAVTSVDKIDQYLDPTGAYANTYTPGTTVNEGATHRQTFVPTEDYLALIAVKIVGKGTGNWKIVVHDASNNIVGGSSDPGTTGIANAALTDGQFFSFPIGGKVTAGQTYHFHILTSVADGTVATNVSSDLEAGSFILYYGRKTDGILITNANGDYLKIDAGVDGLLHNSIIDFSTGRYRYKGRYKQSTSAVDKVPFYMDVFEHGGYTTNFYTNIAANGMPVNSATTYYTLKINTVFAMREMRFRFFLGIAATRSMKLQYSYDNSSFTDIGTYDNTHDVRNLYFNIIPPAGTTVVYLRAVGVSSTCYLQELDVDASIQITAPHLMLPAGSNNLYLSAPSSIDSASRDPSLGATIVYAKVPTIVAGVARTANQSQRFSPRNVGGALRFSANSSGISLAAPLNIPVNSAITYETYFKLAAHDAIRLLFSNYLDSGNQFSIGIRNSSKKIEGSFYNGSSYTNGFTGGTVIEPGKYYHFIYTFNGVARKIYLNGVDDGSSSGNIGGASATGCAFFNRADMSVSNFFKGVAGASRVWNRAFTAKEAQDLYFKGQVPRDSLMVELPLREGSGTTALDTSGNGRNGTIANGTYVTDVRSTTRTQS